MRQCERGAGLVGWAVSCVARVEPAGDLARGRVVLFVAGTGAAPQVGRGSSLRWQLALGTARGGIGELGCFRGGIWKSSVRTRVIKVSYKITGGGVVKAGARIERFCEHGGWSGVAIPP